MRSEHPKLLFLYSQLKKISLKTLLKTKTAKKWDAMRSEHPSLCFFVLTANLKKKQQAAQKAEGDKLLQEAFAKLASGNKVV
jgi:hypothetical protein